ncbi:hypothetical protein [uncultured Devosia sp.]|uniref:hypothetical protein n=1 Tax=uncultured Devosia sp. TaxID=211434 RepID=UPI0035CC2764
MAAKLIDAAETLLNSGQRSSAFRRRAVSTAYYGVFHALTRKCADYLTHFAPRDTEEYNRVYRALDHGPLKQAFGQTTLTNNATLAEIGGSVVRLQAERHKADYAPPVLGVFSLPEAQQLVALARKTVEQIQALQIGSPEVRTLATTLHFSGKRK